VDTSTRPRAPIRSLADFFPGAFAYHWHNAWQEPEDANSYYALFEREIDHRLAASRAAA